MLSLLVPLSSYHFMSVEILHLFFSGAYVSDVTPDYGSLGGETRLTIYGGGEYSKLICSLLCMLLIRYP